MLLQQPFAISPPAASTLFYSPISINAAQVPSTQTDFPVLVSQTDNRFKTVGNGGHVQNANGYDIRPYSDSGLTTAITGYELERYNATTGEVIMWVKVGSLSSSTTPIYLRYGDASITTDGSSATTWSNSFVDVYHLANGTTLSLVSSTGSNNASNTNGVTATSGQIDGAGGFASSSTQYLSSSSGTTAAVTFSAWVNATTFPGAYNGIIVRNVGPNVTYVLMAVKSTGKLAFFVKATTDRSYDGTGANTLSTATWYLLHLTYDSSAGLIGYVNGGSDQTVSANGAAGNSGLTTSIGNDLGNASRLWNGKIDEARMASVARSANWITTEYNNQSAPATFETLDAEVPI